VGTKAVIMAGGKGERFWPLSTPEKPKQFIELTGAGTLIQQTVARAAQIIPFRDIYVVTSREHLALAKEQLPQLPESNFIAEPAGRDTAPCIGLAAVWLERTDPDALMLVLPADHHIPDGERFCDLANLALAHAARTGGLVTLGIQPDRPETGYGYIELGEACAEAGGSGAGGTGAIVHRVRRFHEKPDRVRAEQYVTSGRFLWNAGIFAWSVGSIRAEIARLLPEIHAGLEDLAAQPSHAAMVERLPDLFPTLPRISIDHGVLERAGQVYVVPSDFRWDDLGSWTAAARLHKPDDSGNVLRGRVVADDCRNVFVQSSGRLVATLGVNDLIVVETPDAVLIAAPDRAQEIRRLAVRARELNA